MSTKKFNSEQYKAIDILNGQGKGRFVFVCEHASCFIPDEFDQLGLASDLVESHIAWDPGALAVAKKLSETFDSPLVSAGFSRLLYDCNRPPHAPDAIPTLSEVHRISGNESLSYDEKKKRIDTIYIPFQDGLANVVKSAIEQNDWVILVTIHSFVPIYKGKARTVEIGVLHDDDRRFADGLLSVVDTTSFVVERNSPYGPEDGVTHTLRSHALPHNLPNAMIEIRNDLIENEQGVEDMARFLADSLKSVLSNETFLNTLTQNEGSNDD